MSKPWTMPGEWLEEIEATVNATSHAGRVEVLIDLGATGRPTELLVRPPARRVRVGETRNDSLARYVRERQEDAQ